MGKYRKKPVIVEAMQFFDNAETLTKLSDFIGYTIKVDYKDQKNPILKIPTLEGEHIARVGDWIIKGVNGEFYPCKLDIFQKTYEPVN
ncbi:hypothetical protein Q2T46_11695 [Thermoanaerobacterium sp. CMT5567-10]|uniref:hypothetical protein n=1 Tax=Thermoanaerobacterium sp. CMT5567-10 TaxID=3061989 RepID=UPI0026DF9528|nr:hypothetical protein [Thermoanaerobacterium sp. CMT5567-10]WKV08190.1 hypothetical protein Q2T46_11695 [Thermoanaerobacterium sp. CMT5567-10]